MEEEVESLNVCYKVPLFLVILLISVGLSILFISSLNTSEALSQQFGFNLPFSLIITGCISFLFGKFVNSRQIEYQKTWKASKYNNENEYHYPWYFFLLVVPSYLNIVLVGFDFCTITIFPFIGGIFSSLIF